MEYEVRRKTRKTGGTGLSWVSRLSNLEGSHGRGVERRVCGANSEVEVGGATSKGEDETARRLEGSGRGKADRCAGGDRGHSGGEVQVRRLKQGWRAKLEKEANLR
jgi:hypothetical protein